MYLTVLKEGIGEYEEKKSRFIGAVKRVETEAEAKEFVAKIKGNHKEARHNVYAYIVGENMGIQRYSDDGEPQGTAGVPVLDVLKKKGLTNVAIVVTRYFGGVLLGAGGLVRAYTKSAAVAIDNGKIAQKVLGKVIKISTSYDLLGKLQYIFSNNNFYIENTEYTDEVMLEIFVEEQREEELKSKVVEGTNGKCTFRSETSKYYFKIEDRLWDENSEF